MRLLSVAEAPHFRDLDASFSICKLIMITYL